MVAIDIETYDPLLKAMGSGCMRCDGRILCVGTYNGVKAKAYCPEDDDWEELKELLRSNEPKVFHNGIYDLGWLACSPLYNLTVNGVIHDTMTRAAFIDEYAELGLDACCKRMGVKGKNKDETIEKWFIDHKKQLGLKGSLWDNANAIWDDVEGRQKMIEYNLQDCRATYDLFQAQEPYMSVYVDAYQMECDLYPLLIHMKRNGIRINTDRMIELREEVKANMNQQEKLLADKWSITPSIIKSPKKLATFMNDMGIHSRFTTPSGAESFNSTALEQIDHPIAHDILGFKSLNSLLVKYLDGDMANSIWNDRIYCDFSPNKRDDGGTITGRFSSSSPNLQNISARDMKHGCKTYGQEMRELFLPEEDCWMFACDYSQVEYVLFMHFAKGPQSEEVRNMIKQGIDFHTAVCHMTGITERHLAKIINYGRIYGMGLHSMLFGDNYPTWVEGAKKAGMSVADYGNMIYDRYSQKLPVIGYNMKLIERDAEMFGYVKSISGRRHHKPKPYWNPKKQRWENGIYKMVNYKIQGSAADVLKQALVRIWKSGALNEVKMHLTVHDENVLSVPKTKIGVEAAVEVERCMDMAYSDVLTIPLRAEGGIGDNWGAKHSEKEWQDLRMKYGFGSSKQMQCDIWKSNGHTDDINTLEE